MHLEYAKQLEYKKKNVENVLRKNAQYVGDVNDVVPSSPFAYRNKAQLPFGTVNGKVAVGFYGAGTHKIVSSTKCFLHGEWLEKLIKITLEFANEKGLTAYDEQTKKGLLRHCKQRRMREGLTYLKKVHEIAPIGTGLRLNPYTV